jgi:PP-loop superfamily ATP-utilizing enzyme
MKQLHRHTALPTPESLTRAALKKMTREEMLAAKFADEIMRPRVTTNLIAKPEPKPEPLMFSLGSLIP